MKIKLNYLVLLIILMLPGCGVIKINQGSKMSEDCEEKYKKCEECKIQPKSGPLRDLRYGYYFDITENKCKQISYSSGPGCIPPPFKTLMECKSCCCE